MGKRYGIFGGTFDPFTVAHREIVKTALELKAADGKPLLDKLFIAPTIVDYHRKSKLDAENAPWLDDSEKLLCIGAALKGIENGRWEVWDYDLKKRQLVSTVVGSNHLSNAHRFIDTLLDFKLQKMQPDDKVYVILGTDSYQNLETWESWSEIVHQANLIIFSGRDGYDVKAVPDYAILSSIHPMYASVSATECRKKYRSLGVRKYISDSLEQGGKLLLHTPIFDVVKASPVPEANGLEPFIVKAPDWVAIWAEKNDMLVVEQQLRFGTMEKFPELPCGMVEEGEEPIDAAVRELAEECGIEVIDKSGIAEVGKMSPNPAFMSNTMHVFYIDLNKVPHKKSSQHLDEHEVLEVEVTGSELYGRYLLENAAEKASSRLTPMTMIAAASLVKNFKDKMAAQKNRKTEIKEIEAMDNRIVFAPEWAFEKIRADWTAWSQKTGLKQFVIGISGGVDSSCTAALAAKIFGKENVHAVVLPCDGNQDKEAEEVISHLGLKSYTLDIGDAFASFLNKIDGNNVKLNAVCTTNMPARLRMTALYGFAQCLNAAVVNTSNRSESVCGNDTLWGDDCGSYAPIQMLTKGEVVKLALWLGVPEKLAYKTPVDGLQPLTDEQRLGVTYAEIDAAVRGRLPDGEVKDKIFEMYKKNKFKLEMVHIDGPKFLELHDSMRDK